MYNLQFNDYDTFSQQLLIIIVCVHAYIDGDNNTDDKTTIDLELKEESFTNNKSENKQDNKNFSTKGVCMHSYIAIIYAILT